MHMSRYLCIDVVSFIPLIEPVELVAAWGRLVTCTGKTGCVGQDMAEPVLLHALA